MAEINELLSPVAVKQMREMSKFLKDANAQYATLANTLKKVEAKTKTVGKSEQGLTALQKERARVANQTKTVFAKSLALQEKGTKNLIKGQERLKLAQKAARLEAQKQLGVVKKSGGLFRSMAKSILAASVAMLGFRTVFNVLKNQLKIIASFEEAMSKVRAVTGATVSDFKALTNNAKLLGSSTSKTATEVAGLQLEFSKLGFSTREILAATEATISLSIAAGSDLAESAVVAASTIRGFGLNARETQRVVDVMAKSFASSALDLEKFKTSMAIAAPISKAFGQDIEFTTARLSVLADAGLDASTSGTSLRNIFLELSKRGLTWDEGLAKINNSTNKGVTALDLFGKRGATAALILADNIDKANGLEEAYNGAAGAAEEMARIMEDNLIGDTKQLSSAWEGLILGLERGTGRITTFFRTIIQGGTKAVRILSLLNKGFSEMVDDVNFKILADDAKAVEELAKSFEGALGEVEAYNKAIETYIKQLEAEWEWDDAINSLFDDRIKALKELMIVTDDAAEVTAEAAEEEFERYSNLERIENEHLKRQEAITAFIKQQLKERLGDQEEYTDGLSDELLKRNEKDTEAVNRETENAKKAAIEKHELNKQIRDEAIDAFQETGNILFGLGQAQRDRELETLGSEYDAKIAAAEGNQALQIRLAEELKDKQDALKTEQAQSEKNQALFNIAVDTASGIIKTISNVGLPTAIPLLAIQAAIGATQFAAVASQPIPEFFKGTTDTPFTFTAGEKGSELMIKQDGSVELTPNKTTLYSGKEYEHAQIIPNKQTQEILANKASGESNRELLKEMRLTRKAIERSSPSIHFSRNVGKLNQKHFNRQYKRN